ncbi:hypothetical protein MK079_00275 [Candidatus Gracilibacteria bacterium]|nr:hypothetical protein [Candidatus Gracilibacteria bacterium]
MSRRRNAPNDIVQTLKDYMVPLIALGLFILLLISAFGGGGDDTTLQDTIQNENRVGMSVSLSSGDTEAYIVYPGEKREPIQSDTNLYKGEKILVREGGISANLVSVGAVNLAKLAEFGYAEAGNFTLSSGEAWIDSQSDMEVDMRYAKVKIGENTHVSLSQNEVGSSVYLVNGFIEIQNLAGASTLLAPGQQITISALDASKEDIDLSLQREEIGDFFLSSQWFIQNGGSQYLASNDSQETTSESRELVNASDLISFDNLIDESIVSSNSIDISGSYDSTITSIKLAGRDADLNTDENTFSLSNISLPNRENDLVFKLYDINDNIVAKRLYTLYYEGASSAASSSAFNVTNYAVDASKFSFSGPSSSGLYTTEENFVTIRGIVSDENVTRVSVNDYVLQSYNGSTWRYHASTTHNNLKDGTNVYVVKYFDTNGNLLYQNNYTIVKKDQAPVTPQVEVQEKETSTISDEA